MRVSFAYLDHAASTPMRPEAIAAMLDILENAPGNPSGQHAWARRARRAIDDARDVVADTIGANPGEIVFTSGGTESDNLAILGTSRAVGAASVCFETDHHASVEPVQLSGGVVLSVEGVAALNPQLVRRQLNELGDIAVVSFCAVNSELGLVAPVSELVESIRSAAPRALVHIDAVAAASWLDLRAMWEMVDLMTLSGHKVGGPKGVGVLGVRAGTPLSPVVVGGAQERERRAGTQNLAGAVAMAAALEVAVRQRDSSVERIGELRDRLRKGLLNELGSHVAETLKPDDGAQIPNTLHLCVRDVHREALLLRLDQHGVAASAGSSCASGAPERSHVVEALRMPGDLRDGALRLSLGWNTTAEEVDHALSVIPATVRQLAQTTTSEVAR